jgi:hypothetical protein
MQKSCLSLIFTLSSITSFPIYASQNTYEDESLNAQRCGSQSQARSQMLLARLAEQQSQSLASAPAVPAPQLNAPQQTSTLPIFQGESVQPQPQTRSQMLLGRLAEQQSQSLASAPAVPAPQINTPRVPTTTLPSGSVQPQPQTGSERRLARDIRQQYQNPPVQQLTTISSSPIQPSRTPMTVSLSNGMIVSRIPGQYVRLTGNFTLRGNLSVSAGQSDEEFLAALKRVSPIINITRL